MSASSSQRARRDWATRPTRSRWRSTPAHNAAARRATRAGSAAAAALSSTRAPVRRCLSCTMRSSPAPGLPYLKGGICEVGGTIGAPPPSEAGIYSAAPNAWGLPLKELMRLGVFRRYVTGMSMVGEDLAQLDNRVDLDPDIKDVYGF